MEDLGIVPSNNANITSTTRAVTAAVNVLEEVRCNNRKLWGRVHVRSGELGVFKEIVFEFNFRKKGFMGAWYNYSSETTLGVPSGSIFDSGNKPSLHLYIFPMIYKNGQSLPIQGSAYVIFRGFGSKCGGTKYYFDVNI